FSGGHAQTPEGYRALHSHFPSGHRRKGELPSPKPLASGSPFSLLRATNASSNFRFPNQLHSQLRRRGPLHPGFIPVWSVSAQRITSATRLLAFAPSLPT